MDMEAEYASHYGGAPRAEQTWHQVVAYVQRIGRFETRDFLHMTDSHMMAQPVPKDMVGQRAMVRAKLERVAGL